MRAEGAAAGVPRAARTPSPAARARPRYRYGVRASMYGRSRCAPPSRSRQSRKCRRSASATQCYLIVVSLLYSRDTRHIGHRPLRLRCGSRARAHGHRPRSQACTRQQTALPLCRHSKIAYAPGPSRAPGPSHAPPSMLPRACCSAATNPPPLTPASSSLSNGWRPHPRTPHRGLSALFRMYSLVMAKTSLAWSTRANSA